MESIKKTAQDREHAVMLAALMGFGISERNALDALRSTGYIGIQAATTFLSMEPGEMAGIANGSSDNSDRANKKQRTQGNRNCQIQ